MVTGGSSGLGQATAAAMARLGATVHLVVRDLAKGRAAVTDIRGEVPGAAARSSAPARARASRASARVRHPVSGREGGSARVVHEYVDPIDRPAQGRGEGAHRGQVGHVAPGAAPSRHPGPARPGSGALRTLPGRPPACPHALPEGAAEARRSRGARSALAQRRRRRP